MLSNEDVIEGGPIEAIEEDVEAQFIMA